MFTNVVVDGVSIYHPENKVDNSFFIEYFQSNFNKDITSLLRHLRRKERFLVNNDQENALTMGIAAAKNVLLETHTEPHEIDMIVFVSDTPEYFVPSNALLCSAGLETKNAHVVYDLNANCTGGITAMDQAANMMKLNKKVKKSIVITSLHPALLTKDDCEVTYSSLADGSAAVLLSKRTEETERGILISSYRADADINEYFRSPEVGYSNILNNELEVNKKKLKFLPHDTSYFSVVWSEMIKEMTEEYRIEAKDISKFFFSQMAPLEAEKTLETLGVSLEKSIYVGHRYGYTGSASPFFAYYEEARNKNISQGEYAVFISVGSGYSMSAVLYKS